MNPASPAGARIEAAHRYGAIYRGYLANHYPMAIAALGAMGASEEDLARFDARYLPLLEPFPRGGAFAEAVQRLSAAIESEGAHAVLRSEVGRLVPALASGAFHGAIRTAFAIESGSKRELAHALAYWNAEREDLPPPLPATGTRDAFEVLVELSRHPAHGGRRLPGRNIIERTLAAAQLPDFATSVASVDAASLGLDAVARAVLRAYAGTGDFTLLHGVTGTHAFRLLAPYAGDPAAALQHLWSALVAAYLGAGSPALEGGSLQGADTLDWPAIHARAVRCSDEHDIKLAYSCWREWQHRGDDLYRRVASARVCAAREVAAPAAAMAC